MKTLIGLLPLGLHGFALVTACLLARLLGSPLLTLATYPLLLVLAAGTVARCAAHHIRPGRFDRDPGTPLYRGRMIYGAAWTSLFYCKPVLHLLLSCPPLKAVLFRLFGYRGSLDFTIYPDTWIRDLRLLDFGPGTYISNRATLGTNMVRADGRIQVGGIQTGRNVIIGHLAAIAPGVRLGAGTEVGVGGMVGLKVRTGERVSIGPAARIDHGTRLMDDVKIGGQANIGKCCIIHTGVRIPPGAVIPDRSVILRSDDVEAVDAGSGLRLIARSA